MEPKQIGGNLSPLDETWLVGARGVHQSVDGIRWETLGDYAYPINTLARRYDRIAAGSDWGMWEILPDRSKWIQLHDETLTEVLAVAPGSGDPGMVAGSAYGIAFGKRGSLGETRWASRSQGLSVNETFTNALFEDPGATGRWIVGTEAGVLVYREAEDCWERSDLSDTPCRALCHAGDFFWAGTDDRGVLRSRDGTTWESVGNRLADVAVFSLASSGDAIIAGTLEGVYVDDGSGEWHRRGPRMLVSSVAVHPEDGDWWLAGATPGGLWMTKNAGDTWFQTGDFKIVRSILPPGRGQG
jgi:ligand-binding sensor domain-containing protein